MNARHTPSSLDLEERFPAGLLGGVRENVNSLHPSISRLFSFSFAVLL